MAKSWANKQEGQKETRIGKDIITPTLQRKIAGYVVKAPLREFVRRAPEEAERSRRSAGKALTQKCM